MTCDSVKASIDQLDHLQDALGQEILTARDRAGSTSDDKYASRRLSVLSFGECSISSAP